jgi:alcohol dehydrogenase (cytochrome c)
MITRAMITRAFFLASVLLATGPGVVAQVQDFAPVTQEMLRNPSPNDWLMISRTYDHQRFSPLDQINQQNVSSLRMAWARGMSPGTHEHVPLVSQGVMYIVNPVAVIQALDATDGDLLWEYRRQLPAEVAEDEGNARARNLAIFEDMIYFASPDGFIVALDASTGALRWETMAHDYKAGNRHTSGPIVANGKVITGRSCTRTREGCFIAAHDARTGREVWKFYTTAAPGEPGGDTWGNLPTDERTASPWGLPGSFDPETNLVYWGVANTRPYARIARHGGNLDAVARSAPAELYSNSTVALDADTGKLAWYYQHLPGDDWDFDHVQERILFRTRFTPDANSLKWINPRIQRNQERSALVTMGEPGGLWALDSDWRVPVGHAVPVRRAGISYFAH